MIRTFLWIFFPAISGLHEYVRGPWKFCRLIILLLLLPASAHAQHSRLVFEHLDVDKGLSAADVRPLLQDRYGFIWIGTLDGLDMYDGYGFTHYKHKPFDAASLTANAITALYEDKGGTLWVGTVNGLCRMNPEERAAERFFQFQNDPADSNSLSANAISAICEDEHGNIWVGTYGGGLNRLNPQTNSFTRYLARPGVSFGLNDDVITSLRADNSGGLWVGTMHAGLQKFEAATERFFTHTWQHPNHLKKYERYPPAVFAFIDSLQRARAPLAALLKVADSEERRSTFRLAARAEVLIIATGEGINAPLADYGGLERAGAATPVWQMRFERTRHAGGALKNRVLIETAVFFAGSYALRYLSDNSHSFERWNTRPPDRPQDWGIQIFLLEATMARRLKMQLQQTFLPAALSHPFVTAIMPEPSEKKSALWIGTANGLNRFDTQREIFTNYFHDPADSNSLSGNHIAALCESDSGKILIGAKTGGLLEFDTKLSRFRRIDTENTNGRSLAQHRTNDILKDRVGSVWVSTEDAALFKSGIKKFRHHRAEDKRGLTNNEVRAFCEDREGALWLGTSDGLFAYDRARSRYTHFKHDPRDPKSLSGNHVMSIYEDEAGVLWIATAGAGLNHFDPRTGRVQRYRHNSQNPHSLPADDLLHIYVDHADTLWVGTILAGMAHFDEVARRFTRFNYNPKDTTGFINKTVNHIFEDRVGEMWFGTYSGGLCRMQKETEGRITFAHYTTADGLPSHMIQGMLQDDAGIFWISTSNGLSRFDPSRTRGRQFRNFSVADGLQGKPFHLGACYKSRNGEMFFGGSNGFNRFFPQEVKAREYARPCF